jgi:glycosyltransferase involved in cell wall biosynthesis
VHVGLNLAFLVPGEGGGRETHARELALALAETRPDLRLTSFVGRDARGRSGFWREVGRVVSLPITPRSRPQWAWAELAAVPVAAARAGVDVLHSPANLGPITGPFARVLTLHDLLYRRHPELLTPAMRWGTEALLPAAARRAHRVVTVSRASRDEIVAELGIPSERIDVVPNGVTSPAAGDAAAARTRLAAGDRQIALSVASDLPHKNLASLLDALALIPSDERPVLALAGHGTDGPRLRDHALFLGVEEDLRLIGAVSVRELEDLYAAADVLVTTTRYEGFGIPILEAMARGVPVACSDLPVLREIAGEAARWLDPDEPGTVAGAIRELLGGGPEAGRLREAGLERARRFSWKAAAAATAASYERALYASRNR